MLLISLSSIDILSVSLFCVQLLCGIDSNPVNSDVKRKSRMVF